MNEDQEKVEAEKTAKDIPLVTEEEKKAFMQEATELVLHIPRWVIPQHEIFYRMAYLQVKQDEKASKQSAGIRTKVIQRLMNKMIKEMTAFFQKEQEAKEKESGVKSVVTQEIKEK